MLERISVKVHSTNRHYYVLKLNYIFHFTAIYTMIKSNNFCQRLSFCSMSQKTDIRWDTIKKTTNKKEITYEQH